MSTATGTTYDYECSRGHWVGARKPLTACTGCVHGKPCDGELTRVGKGSRSAGKMES